MSLDANSAPHLVERIARQVADDFGAPIDVRTIRRAIDQRSDAWTDEARTFLHSRGPVVRRLIWERIPESDRAAHADVDVRTLIDWIDTRQPMELAELTMVCLGARFARDHLATVLSHGAQDDRHLGWFDSFIARMWPLGHFKETAAGVKERFAAARPPRRWAQVTLEGAMDSEKHSFSPLFIVLYRQWNTTIRFSGHSSGRLLDAMQSGYFGMASHYDACLDALAPTADMQSRYGKSSFERLRGKVEGSHELVAMALTEDREGRSELGDAVPFVNQMLSAVRAEEVARALVTPIRELLAESDFAANNPQLVEVYGRSETHSDWADVASNVFAEMCAKIEGFDGGRRRTQHDHVWSTV